MMDKNITTETITNLTKGIVLEDDRIQNLYEKICIVKAVFHGVHFMTAEGAATLSEIDEAMSGVDDLLNSLADNAESAMEFSNGLVKEVM